MDDFGKDLSESGVVLSSAKLRERRERYGQCVTCGQQCFKKKALKLDKKLLANAVLDRLQPLTVDGLVLNGRCLKCNPQTAQELEERIAQVSQRVSLNLGLGEEGAEEGRFLESTSAADGAASAKQGGSRRKGLKAAESVRDPQLEAAMFAATSSSRFQSKGSHLSAESVGRTGSAENLDDGDGVQSPRHANLAAISLSHDEFFKQYNVPTSSKSQRFQGDDAAPPSDPKNINRSAYIEEERPRSRRLEQTAQYPPDKRAVHDIRRKSDGDDRDERKPNKSRGDKATRVRGPGGRRTQFNEMYSHSFDESGRSSRSYISARNGHGSSSSGMDAGQNVHFEEKRSVEGSSRSMRSNASARRGHGRSRGSMDGGHNVHVKEKRSFEGSSRSMRSNASTRSGHVSSSDGIDGRSGGNNGNGNEKPMTHKMGSKRGDYSYRGDKNLVSKRVGFNETGDKNAISQRSSAEIGKIRRRSVRMMKMACVINSSSSSSSTGSSNDSSSSSSFSDGDDDGSSSSFSSSEIDDLEEESDESSIQNLDISWREKETPEEKMQSILDHLSDAAIKSANDLAGIREARSALDEEVKLAKKTKWYASRQVKDAEERQVVAVEHEDYELAERLGDVILANQKALKKQVTRCVDMNKMMLQLDGKKKAAVRLATLCLKEAQIELGKLHDELIDCGKEDEEIASQFSAEFSRLSSESERLSRNLKVIEREEEFLAKEKVEFVGGEMQEFEKKIEEDGAKLLKANERVEELRKQIAEAEGEAANIKDRIAASKESIVKIKAKNIVALQGLERKSESTQAKRTMWESENKAYEEARSTHEAGAGAHSLAVVSRDKLIITADEESLAIIDLEEIVASVFNADEKKEKGGGVDEKCRTYAQDSNEDASEVDSVVIYEALVDEKQELILEAETNIDNLLDEISAIEDRVPLLEAKKKKAASARDFKSAGRASKKIKEALARKEKCMRELKGEAREREISARDELKRHMALLEEKRRAAHEKGRETGKKRMEQLEETRSSLRSTLTKLASKSAEEATEVSVIVGFLINAQLSALNAEGRSLGEKYGGWEETTQEDDIVEEFLATMIAKAEATANLPFRQGRKLSMLLDKKIGAKSVPMNSAIKDFLEEEDGRGSEVDNSTSTLTLNASEDLRSWSRDGAGEESESSAEC